MYGLHAHVRRQRLVKAAVHSPQGLRRGGAVEVTPEKGQELLSGERVMMRGEVVEAGAALAAGNSERLPVQDESRRPQQ